MLIHCQSFEEKLFSKLYKKELRQKDISHFVDEETVTLGSEDYNEDMNGLAWKELLNL